ncbi:TIGR03435 family protein [Terriglobus sp. TAA 43]|uniref:TIGR03435 family protein n=1 Tax=Terriglobus sp. TAA 43 TaxID=278961 RepID=UPI0006486CD9|nr:TIGR03435 family protein [Terriglobus sp. TAA 43]
MRIRLQLPAIVALLVFLNAAHAQQTPKPAIAFETAAIHPSHVTPECSSIPPPGSSHFDGTCLTLRLLLQIAFKPEYPDSIEGSQHALDSHYDVRASLPDGVTWNYESLRPLMQQLLIERFHLTYHFGTRSVSGYEITTDKNGTRLTPVSPDSVEQGKKAGELTQNFFAPGHIQARGIDADGLAGMLSLAARVPVVNHTGLTGLYNMDLRYAPDDAASSDLPSFPTAIKEQLGLNLKPAKVPVKTIVIDHVDEVPIPN